MNIQSVSLAQSNFTSNNSRRTNADRTATLQDLYEMEDRITANQEKLIKKQNEMIGKTLQSISQLISRGFDDEYFDQAMDDATMLKLNVNV